MSSDEEDYMSDKYLAKETEDIRPGIPKRKVDERALHQYKKKLKTQIPNKQENEANKRTEGLNTAISSSNKGFQMLAKMGYKTGTSLGSSNTGIIEPIGINLKSDKGGLGKTTRPTRKTPKVEVTKEMQDTFRKDIYEKKTSQMIRRFYYKAQSSCMNLDHQNDVEQPVKEFYWPKKLLDEIKRKEKLKLKQQTDGSEDSESSDDEELEAEEEEEEINEDLLKDLVEHLRNTYFYCIYCAAKACDQEDLDSFCPGENYEDHDMD